MQRVDVPIRGGLSHARESAVVAGGLFGDVQQPRQALRRSSSIFEPPPIVEDGEHVLRGLCCPTGVATYRDYRWLCFGEGAFDEFLRKPHDVVVIVGHDAASIPLARTANGTARFWSDAKGLWGEYVLSRSPLSDSVYEAVRRGDLSGQSICHSEDPSDRVTKAINGKRVEVINRVRAIHEVSLLWCPQFIETSIQAVPRRGQAKQSKSTGDYSAAACRRRLAELTK